MEKQNYYANLPTKLMKEKFRDREDRNLHLLAITIITSWVNTQTGEFYLSIRQFAKELECSEKVARRVITNLISWGYIRKISNAKNQYGQSIYKLSTYDFNEKEGTAKDTATDTAKPAINQYPEQILGTAKDTATDAQINNNITNNEIKEEEKQKIDFGGGENLEIENEDLVNEVELKKEIDHLIAIYPKKIANFTRLNERYFRLRIYHALTFRQIKEAVENYMLENDGTETQFLKNLDNLLVYEELHPFLFKPVIAIDKDGKKIHGEFCISNKVFRFETPTGTKQVVFDNEKFEEMIEQGRLIFRELEQVACVN